MPKIPDRAEMDIRIARKVIKLLSGESMSTKRRIMDFVSSSLHDADMEEKREALLREGTFPRAVPSH